MASQLAGAIYAVRTVRLVGDAEGTPVLFKATDKTLVSSGWQAVYAGDTPNEDAEKDKTSSSPIPALAVDGALMASDGRLLAKKTKPPMRFRLLTPVVEVEKLEIGRPSTYTAILGNIMTRDYITEDKKGYLLPSSTGEVLRDGLVGRFEFTEFDYTHGLEDQLDQVAEEQTTYLDMVSSAWASFDTELVTLESAALPAAHPCLACVKTLCRIKGENGFFWACFGCECETTLPDVRGRPGEWKAPPTPTGITCPKCGKELAHHVGTGKSIKRGMKPRPYDFYSCTGFPKCGARCSTDVDGEPVFGDDTPAAQEAS